jgi:hypothetical protein
LGREDAYIVYKDQKWRVDFYAGACKGRKVHLLAASELSDEDIRNLIPNLEMGLRQLGFEEYSISKESGTFKASSVLRIHQNHSTD